MAGGALLGHKARAAATPARRSSKRTFKQVLCKMHLPQMVNNSHTRRAMQWYTEKYTAAFGSGELDAIRKRPGFGGRDVSQLISCIDGGAAVFEAIDIALANKRPAT